MTETTYDCIYLNVQIGVFLLRLFQRLCRLLGENLALVRATGTAGSSLRPVTGEIRGTAEEIFKKCD